VSRDQLDRLANEQAALRRVATLVARGVPAAEVFATVAEEVGRLFGADMAHIVRFEADETVTLVAGWSREGDHLPVGSRYTLEGHSLSAMVLRTGRPARVNSYSGSSGSIAADLHQRGHDYHRRVCRHADPGAGQRRPGGHRRAAGQGRPRPGSQSP